MITRPGRTSLSHPLTLMALISVLFWWNRYGVVAFFILVASVGFLQMPAAKRIAERESNLKFIYLAWITFLRAFARGLGMGQGIRRFWLSNSGDHSGIQREKTLRQVTLEIRASLPQTDILVVNDGSIDSTARVAREAGVLF